MNLCTEINWYAVQTKPAAEATAQHSIDSLNLETFFPRARRERLIGGAVRPFIKALFPNYLFARFRPAQYLHLIRYCRGVCRVVSARETPLPVEDQIICEIRARVGDDGCVRLEEKPWRPGDTVRIDEGPFRGCSGIFERELDDRRRVVILLEAIQSARIVLERRCLIAAEAA